MNSAIGKAAGLEKLLLVLLGGFSALFLLLTWSLHPTAALFPRWVAIAGLLFLACAVGARRSAVPTHRSKEVDEDFPQPTAAAITWLTVLALQLVYITAIYLVGFTSATVLYLLIAPVQMGYRGWVIIALQAVFLTAIVSGSFIWLFHLRLPQGILWSLF